MADLNTKQKIIRASIQLFNQHGLANVRLQQIADEIGISVGNLAYHFKNKESIILTINEELFVEAAEILSSYRVYPNLMDFDNQLNIYFKFIQKYPFYFLDILEIARHYPKIYAKRQAQLSKMMKQILMRFEYNQQRGIIQAEARAGLYKGSANAIWLLISTWLPQRVVQGEVNNYLRSKFKDMVWNQFYPYLSPKGKAEYEALILPVLENQYK